MATSYRSPAQQESDAQGGYRSLAGYVFQLLGSASEAVELVRINQNASGLDGLLTLEQFGQDSFVSLVPDTDKSRFTQYKHSLTENEITPGELREILERFAVSLELARKEIKTCDFVLATNRAPSPWTRNLNSTREKLTEAPEKKELDALEEQLWRNCTTPRPRFADTMLEIYRRLNWQQIDEDQMIQNVTLQAYNLGVPERDVDEKIRATLGLFLNIASLQKYRTISRTTLYDTLAGHPHARELRSHDSRLEQKQLITNALMGIHRRNTVARREIVNEIVSASLAYPLVLVVGDGGRGKSAGAWQSLNEHLRDANHSPDFVTGRHFAEFSESALINEFARWRNQGPDRDGTSIFNAFERLEAGCRHSNLLVLYIDGIDEKFGQIMPYAENQRFISRLLSQITRENPGRQEKKISFVVSCRTLEEASWLTDIIGDENIKTVQVDHFSDSELEELASSLEDEPKKLLLSMVSDNQYTQRRLHGKLNEEIINPLREPRVWASFVGLDTRCQIDYLKKTITARNTLAREYLRRIETKAAERLSLTLSPHVVQSILEETKRASLQMTSEIYTRSQWIQFCREESFNQSQALQLFDEFVTAGLLMIVTDRGRTWSWKQLWVRDALCDEEVAQ